jgi:hypothetical protein
MEQGSSYYSIIIYFLNSHIKLGSGISTTHNIEAHDMLEGCGERKVRVFESIGSHESLIAAYDIKVKGILFNILLNILCDLSLSINRLVVTYHC